MEYASIVTNVKSGVIQTPAYVFDIDILRRKVAMICEILGGHAKMCYAIKANPFVLKPIDDMVPKYEVCSPGELEICRSSGIPMEKIVFSGINKTRESVDTAAKYGVGVMTVESLHQFDLIAECAARNSRTIRVILRLTNGSQFGINEKDIESLIARREEFGYVHMLGVQYFTGTQKKKSDHIIKELEYANAFCARLMEQYHYNMEQFEYGTGLWVPYFTGDSFDGEFTDLMRIRDYLAEKKYPYEVILEMGRYPVASCGYFATKVEDCKTNKDVNYCIIDGGIHHINYYGQNMALKTPIIDHYPMHRQAEDTEKEWMLCGSLCTFNDVVARKVPVKDLRIGDYFIFHHIGAYAVTEGGYLFLSRNLPRIYFADERSGIRLVREGISSHIMNTPNEGPRLDKSYTVPVRSEEAAYAEPGLYGGSGRADASDSVFPLEREADQTIVIPSAAILQEIEQGAPAPRVKAAERSRDNGPEVMPLERRVNRPAAGERRRFVPETDVPDDARQESSRRRGGRRQGASRQPGSSGGGKSPRADSDSEMGEPGRPSRDNKNKKPSRLPFFLIALVILAGGSALGVYFKRRVINEYRVEAGTTVMTSDLLRYEADKEKNQGAVALDTSIPGYYPVEIVLAPFTYQVDVYVTDTTAPEAVVRPMTLTYGTQCRPEDFAEQITDASPVTVTFVSNPDFEAVGEQQVRLLFTDSAGNATELMSTLTIKEPLPFDEEAPVVGTEDIYVTQGGTVSYKKVIQAYDNVDTQDQLTIEVDNSGVNLNEIGDYPYTVTVTDRNGNAASAEGMVHVLEAGSQVADIDEVNAMADAILAEILTDDMTPKDQLRAIYDWVQSSTHYEGNAEENDAALAAYIGFTEHKGNCFTYASQAQFLLTRAGIDNLIVEKLVPEGRTDISTHRWNLVNIGEGWYHYDCTPRKDRRDFFYLTDAELQEYSDSHEGYGTHVFDHSLYPEIQ